VWLPWGSPIIFCENVLHEVCSIRRKEQIDEKRSTAGTDSLLTNTADTPIVYWQTRKRSTAGTPRVYGQTRKRSTAGTPIVYWQTRKRSTADTPIVYRQTRKRSTAGTPIVYWQTCKRSTAGTPIVYWQTRKRSTAGTPIVYWQTRSPSITYVVNQKLIHFDDVSFIELFVWIRVVLRFSSCKFINQFQSIKSTYGSFLFRQKFAYAGTKSLLFTHNYEVIFSLLFGGDLFFKYILF
jgi:hypothetical protein